MEISALQGDELMSQPREWRRRALRGEKDTRGIAHELERELERLGVQRNISLRLPDFLGIGALVAQTDLMITVPVRVVETLMRIADVKMLKPPFNFPGFAIKQHWHERYQQDPSNRWLRSIISDLFLER